MKHNEKKHFKLDRRSKETIMKDKAMWSEAARTDSFSLNLEEFLAFQHPESSNANLQSLVDDILREFDLDTDDYLTADEFSNVLPHDLGETTSKGFTVFQDMDERREEFNKILDTNKDGKVKDLFFIIYVL
jgi:calcium-binding protein